MWQKDLMKFRHNFKQLSNSKMRMKSIEQKCLQLFRLHSLRTISKIKEGILLETILKSEWRQQIF